MYGIPIVAMHKRLPHEDTSLNYLYPVIHYKGYDKLAEQNIISGCPGILLLVIDKLFTLLFVQQHQSDAKNNILAYAIHSLCSKKSELEKILIYLTKFNPTLISEEDVGKGIDGKVTKTDSMLKGKFI